MSGEPALKCRALCSDRPAYTRDYFFISILSDFLNSRETSAPDYQVDWESILSIAKKHEVRGIIYLQCKHLLPEPYRSQFEQLYGMEIYTYHNRVRMFEVISAALHEASIPYFTVKGLDVAALYPEPALRTMGDCDIVVKSEDRERAHEIFLALGYDNQLRRRAGEQPRNRREKTGTQQLGVVMAQ